MGGCRMANMNRFELMPNGNYITNISTYNVNKNNELPHNEILYKPKLPNVKKLYPSVVKHLAKLASTSPNKAYGKTTPDNPVTKPLHIMLITATTSDAEEQFALLTIYWKCCGLKHATAKNYNKLSPSEIAKIREWYIAGKSIYAIAKALNRHPSTIYYVLKRLGLK